MSKQPANTSDSEDLEALFDSISSATVAHQNNTEVATAEAILADPDDAGNPDDAVFSKLGHMTRELHDTLRKLGYDKSIESAVSSMPDARDRLNYIAAMTEKAAERALTATEKAIPIQDKIESGAVALSSQWDRLFSSELSVDEFKLLVSQTRDYLATIPVHTKETNVQMMEVMMAQDFQDLTGQVIKKVIDVAQNVEQQLVRLLVESAPQDRLAEVDANLLNGPVVNGEGRSDVVTSQAQVDDLLDSLGF